ncbi:hypothetical protein [Pseudomonas sp. 382]|uniref:hypothetical protein n=1 Tax=Pseudomonas sp. 382 TaxID=1751969 RepID=UPI00117B6557|nr:hypothetical protein [Pseudomonas sp. 382]
MNLQVGLALSSNALNFSSLPNAIWAPDGVFPHAEFPRMRGIAWRFAVLRQKNTKGRQFGLFHTLNCPVNRYWAHPADTI